MVFNHFSCMIGDNNSVESHFPVTTKTASPSSVASPSTTTVRTRRKTIDMGTTPKEEKKFLSNLDQHLNAGQEDKEIANPNEKTENLRRVAGFGVGVGSLYLQEAFGFPFLVLRRQCQANHTGARYHVLPFSLFPIIRRIHDRQGISVFWKGWGSACIVKGATIATEILIFELLHIPRDAQNKREPTLKETVMHETLKGCSLILTLPLYSASLIDSVQTLELDQPRSMFSFLKDAMCRSIGWYTSRGHGHLLPFYSLVFPSIACGFARYIMKTFVSSFINRSIQLQKNSSIVKINKTSMEDQMKTIYYNELLSNFLSSLVTEILMYPLETSLLRLHLQGTRTIIDDTDKGYGVVPLCTNYHGLLDCIREIQKEEGFFGFYKGFGALLLQYFVHLLVLKSAKILYQTS